MLAYMFLFIMNQIFVGTVRAKHNLLTLGFYFVVLVHSE